MTLLIALLLPPPASLQARQGKAVNALFERRNRFSIALLLFGVLAASAAASQAAAPGLMEEEILAFESDYKEGLALLASVQGRAKQVDAGADLEALAAQEGREYARIATIVDDIYRRRNRFRVQANGLQVAVIAAQVNTRRADKPKYDMAIRYREANDKMTTAFKTLQYDNDRAHQAFLARLVVEKGLRRKARLLRRAGAAALAVAALMLAAFLLLRARKPPSSTRRPRRIRPDGPAKLE